MIIEEGNEKEPICACRPAGAVKQRSQNVTYRRKEESTDNDIMLRYAGFHSSPELMTKRKIKRKQTKWVYSGKNRSQEEGSRGGSVKKREEEGENFRRGKGGEGDLNEGYEFRSPDNY